MVREELVTGLKNALARGQSLEKAMNSLLSAGYNPEEVKDASNYANVGVTGNTGVINSLPKTPIEIDTTAIQKNQPIPKLNENQPEPKKSKVGLILLISLLVVLVIGIFGMILFGDQILQTLFPK
jgi:hypothetical protein